MDTLLRRSRRKPSGVGQRGGQHVYTGVTMVLRPARLSALLVPVILLSACAADEPEPPAPTVSTQEFEHRLDEHLSRFASRMLEPEAQVAVPIHSRTEGCAGGPSWGVVPRAEVTVTAGDQAEKLVEDLQTWMGGNGFSGVHDDEDNDWHTGNPADFREVTGAGADGTAVLVRLTRNAPRFTIAVTGPCTWPPERDGNPPRSGRLAPLPAPSAPWSAIGVGSLTERMTCRSPKLWVFNDAAPPFTGPGPHPMVIAVYTANTEPENPPFLYSDVHLPIGSRPGDEHQAQLVVCVHVATTRDTGHNVSCNYTTNYPIRIPGGSGVPYDFEVFESIYRFTVLEARTSAVVAEFTMPGTLDDKQSCPYNMQNYKEPLARGIDNHTVEQHLQPLYESAR